MARFRKVKMMANPISADKFAEEINAILSEYQDAIDADIAAITKQVAREAVQNVRANAPVRTGEYRKSIGAKVQADGVHKSSGVIYAKAPHYRLTHLLEHGHAKLNGGRTQAFPHWTQAEQKAVGEIEKRIKEAIQK